MLKHLYVIKLFTQQEIHVPLMWRVSKSTDPDQTLGRRRSGWSGSTLFAHVRRSLFAWRWPFVKIDFCWAIFAEIMVFRQKSSITKGHFIAKFWSFFHGKFYTMKHSYSYWLIQKVDQLNIILEYCVHLNRQFTMYICMYSIAGNIGHAKIWRYIRSHQLPQFG